MTRLLLLDGYDESREASATHLRAAGYDVIAVEEEADAVAALTSADEIDFVLLDVPIAEAEEAASALRAALPSGRPAMKVIALVDPSVSRQLREAGHANGIDYFFLRPCPPAEMMKHLQRLRR